MPTISLAPRTQLWRQEDYCRSFVQNCDLKSGTDVGPFDIYFFLEMEKNSCEIRTPTITLRIVNCLFVQQISPALDPRDAADKLSVLMV